MTSPIAPLLGYGVTGWWGQPSLVGEVAVMISGSVPAVTAPALCSPTTATVTITGQMLIIAAVNLEPATSTVTVTGGSPTVTVPATSTPTTATVTATGGSAPTLFLGAPLHPAAAAAVIIGNAAAVMLKIVITPTAATATITRGTPSVGTGVSPAATTVSITTGTPTLISGPQFDAIGAGVASATSHSSFSYSHTAASGAKVFLFTATPVSAAINSVTFGGTAMSKLTDVSPAGTQALYYLASAPGGTSTVQILMKGVYSCYANSISVTAVSSVGSPITSSGGGTALTDSVSCTSGQLIIQSFMDNSANSITSYSGGTGQWSDTPGGNSTLTLSSATATTTFTATDASAATYSAISVVLS